MLEACVGQVPLQKAARELATNKFDLVGVQEVTWDKGGTVRAGKIFSMEKEKKINWKQDFFLYTTT
jgi:hypothetical protein